MKYFISSAIWFCISGFAGIAAGELFGHGGTIMLYAAFCFGISGAFTHSLFVCKNNFKLNAKYAWVAIGLITLLVSILFLSILFSIWSGSSGDNIGQLWFFTKLLFVPALAVSLLGECLIRAIPNAQ
jgi:hypothetical protein